MNVQVKRWGLAACLRALSRHVRRFQGDLGRLRGFAVYHGLWAPGVRLLRNLRLRSKALLIAAFVGVPAGCLIATSAAGEFDRYRASQERVASLRQMQALGTLTHSLTTLLTGAVRAELGLGDLDTSAALAEDQRRYLALAEDNARRPAAPSVVDAWQALGVSRQAMMAQAENASPSALPGRNGLRTEAMSAYGEQLDRLRRVIARATGIAVDAPAPIQALADVASRAGPELRSLVGRTVRIGAPLYEADERGMSGERLSVFAAQARSLLDTVQGDLAYAAEHGIGSEASLTQPLDAVRRHVDNASALARAARTSEARASLAEAAGVDRTAYLAAGRDALSSIEAVDSAGLANLLAWGEAQAQFHRRRMLWFAAGVLTWLFGSAYLIVCTYRVLNGGLQTLCEHLEAIGGGDLSRKPRAYGRDEIGRALKALGASTAHMAQLFGAVTQGVAAVSQASREVAGGNAGLSSRTGAVRELIAGVSARAQGCSTSLDVCSRQVEQTAELIIGMRADGERSRKAMGGLREGMARLQVKSHEIVQVVALVEAVAYQTKLLSINASVEAARAGLAGRGFAVVAHEVRALAVRSEKAARRINEIVGSSVEEIESGGILADRAGTAVLSTEQRIEAVDGLMRETVRLTRSGRTESQEVLAISRSLEESITGNVRVVEQLAEASADLREQGDSLKRSVQHFVLG